MSNAVVFENDIELSSNYIHVTDTENSIDNSEMEDEKIKETFTKMLYTCYAGELKNEPVTKKVSKLIKNYIEFSDVERDKMDQLVLETFSTKDVINEIYKLKAEDNEYWLIVNDTSTDQARQCYDEYFDLLDQSEDFFELRILNTKDLDAAMYMKPEKIWGRN